MITETWAEVNIQTLLNLTVPRLLMQLHEVLETISEAERELERRCKWGYDGSQHVQYMQKFFNSIN